MKHSHVLAYFIFNKKGQFQQIYNTNEYQNKRLSTVNKRNSEIK